MPLKKGKSKKIIGENIAEMEKTHPRAQAIAAALETAREAARQDAKTNKKQKRP